MDEAVLDEWQAANVREMQRIHANVVPVPSDLVAAQVAASAACEYAWRDTRASGDYANLLPLFRPVIAVTRQIVAAKAQEFGIGPYKALMEPYGHGRGLTQVRAMFDELEPFLRNALSQASELALRLPTGLFLAETQRVLGRQSMQRVG